MRLAFSLMELLNLCPSRAKPTSPPPSPPRRTVRLPWAVDHIEGVRTLLEVGADPDARDQPCVLRYGASTLTVSLSLTLTLTIPNPKVACVLLRHAMLPSRRASCAVRRLQRDVAASFHGAWMTPRSCSSTWGLACGQVLFWCTQSRGCWCPLGTSPLPTVYALVEAPGPRHIAMPLRVRAHTQWHWI